MARSPQELDVQLVTHERDPYCCFVRPRGGLLKLSAEALAVMRSHAQHVARAKEAGGVLVGRHIIETRDVIVDLVTPPFHGDRRMRTSFHRARVAHQRALDSAWGASRGTRVYLGEWHTHPEPIPSPSPVDLDDWRARLRRDEVEADFLAFVIVGQRHVRVWEGCRADLVVTALLPHGHDCSSLGGHHDEGD